MAPDQFGGHGAIVALQELIVRQGGLAAGGCQQLLLVLDQGGAALQQLLGQPPGFDRQGRACLQQGYVRGLILGTQGQQVDGLRSDL